MSTLMNSQTFNELFPTKTSFFVFISYMGLFINQGKSISTQTGQQKKTQPI